MNHTHEGGRIVVGVDGSEHSIHALQQAQRYAALLGARLQAVTAWQYPLMLSAYPVMEWNPGRDAAEVLDNALASAFGQDGHADVEKTVTQGQPALVLLDASRGAELLVVGCRGKGGFAGLLLGSVSSAVAAHAHCSVLVTHMDEHRHEENSG
ncbi:universal stress protein [Arthrobacter crystallopoietes]|uniref:universal stress protein n=1 Tax=Crystallibacter crystallopoietes TaxID=37928 RepID=UPI00111114C0|nr:universal stress protein [Arthrobacter crystallopoietes]